MRSAPPARSALKLFKSTTPLPWVAALLLLAAIPCSAEEAPKLPDGVDPLPKEFAFRMKDLLKNAEKYRGLRCLHAVPSGSLKEDALRAKMKLSFEEELPPEKMKPLDSSLKSFGLIPETMDLAKFYPELLTSQVGGYYDPRRQYLVIVQREGGLLGPDATKQFGAAMAKKMEETVMVHELTHAIQDQNFNLRKFMIDDPLSDAGAARLALVEGDATLTMYDFLTGMRMESMPGIDDIISKMVRDPQELMALTPDMPGGKELANAPAWFRDGMLFTYMQGYVFCIKVKKIGGQALLDHAFTKDPPRSTEQILHPEKWYGLRDDPIEITLPDLTGTLAGWTKLSEGTLGELGIKLWINETLKDNEKAATAAEGWGGDRFAVYEKGGARFLAWVTDWDTADDATKFKTACAALKSTEWTVTTSGTQRVTLTRSTLDAKTIAAAHEKLNGAKATPPANKRIDIAAVKRDAKPNTPDATDIAEAPKNDNAPIAGDPGKFIGKNGDIDIDALLKSPEMADALKQFGGGDGLDMGELMKNPLFKEMLKKMLSTKSGDGKVSADGQEYTNPETGISIKLPESAKGWKINAKPNMPMTLALLESPDHSARIQIVSQPMPIEMPIDTMGPMLEMGFKMGSKNYKKLSEGSITAGDQKGYEFQFTGDTAGMTVRMTARFFSMGGKLMVLNASAGQEDWKRNEKAMTDILNALTLSKPKAAKKQDDPDRVNPDDVLR